MEIVLKVAQIVTPVFLTIGVGAAWVKSGRAFPTKFVTEFATRIAVPALILVVLMRSELTQEAVTVMLFASVLAYAAAGILFALVCLILGLRFQTYLAPLTFGNTGNLGLPLALFAFGEAGLELAVVVFTVSSVLVFSFGVAVVSGQFDWRRLLVEPIIWGTLIGFGLLYTDTELPVWMGNFLNLLGQMAIPMVLITLGASLVSLTGAGFLWASLLAALKMAICILIGWSAGTLLGLEGLALSVLILQIATPVAVTSFILAGLYDAEPEKVATFVIASTLLSVLFLPVLLGVLL